MNFVLQLILTIQHKCRLFVLMHHLCQAISLLRLRCRTTQTLWCSLLSVLFFVRCTTWFQGIRLSNGHCCLPIYLCYYIVFVLLYCVCVIILCLCYYIVFHQAVVRATSVLDADVAFFWLLIFCFVATFCVNIIFFLFLIPLLLSHLLLSDVPSVEISAIDLNLNTMLRMILVLIFTFFWEI